MSDSLAAVSEAQTQKSLQLLKEQRRQDCARRQLAPL
jgi:hypothetical protein